MSRNKCFFSGSNITCFTFYIFFVTYLLTLPHIGVSKEESSKKERFSQEMRGLF
jgi:hypothetical protein